MTPYWHVIADYCMHSQPRKGTAAAVMDACVSSSPSLLLLRRRGRGPARVLHASSFVVRNPKFILGQGIVLVSYRIVSHRMRIPNPWQGNTCRTHRYAPSCKVVKRDLPVALRLMLSASMADREVVTGFGGGLALGVCWEEGF